MIKVRHIRIDDELWEQLEKEAFPEKVSGFIRMALREFIDQRKTNSVVGRKNKIENQSRT